MVRLSLHVLSKKPTASIGPRLDRSPRRLVDSHGRVIRDLRLSITDRCNFRCVYCMDPGVEFRDRAELLTPDELVRVARLCMGLGVERLRLTGGEPTVRPELEEIMSGLAELGPLDLAMTTNGSACTNEGLAKWKSIGLRRLTFSLDAVSPGVFARMSRGASSSDRVIAAIRDALETGLTPIKVNAVVVRGQNEGEVGPLTLLARELGVEMRFIEFMPLDAGKRWEPALLVPAEEILARAGAAAELVPLGRDEASSTSESYAFAEGGSGRVGVIAPVTRPFCGACSRLRVTADGRVRSCLFSLEEHDLRGPMRSGASDREVEDLLLHAVWNKQEGHGIGREGFTRPERAMFAIGG